MEAAVFSQVMGFLPHNAFNSCVARYGGNRSVRRFSCMDQFLCLAFAQLAYRESLWDIEACLRAMRPKLYHMGTWGHVARSTLACANENRNWRIYADFAQVLVAQARPLYQNHSFGAEPDGTVYALDSTAIDLCLSLFPGAHFRKTKGEVKLHTLLNLRGSIPEFIHATAGNVHDVNILDTLAAQPGAFYVMDRACLDFGRPETRMIVNTCHYLTINWTVVI